MLIYWRRNKRISQDSLKVSRRITIYVRIAFELEILRRRVAWCLYSRVMRATSGLINFSFDIN